MTVNVSALYSKAAQGGFAFYLPAMPDMPMPLVFEAGLPDPTTFPVDDLTRLIGKVLERDRNDLQYGTPVDGDLSYGFAGLRDRLAGRAAAIDGRTDVDKSGVLLTSGGVQAISLAAHAFLDPGDVCAVELPTWEYILRDVTLTGAEAVSVPIDDDGLQIDALEDQLRRLAAEGRRLKLLYTIPTFNVPTGVCLSLERRRRLVALAAEHEFMIIEDNVYGDLRYEGDPLPSLFSLDEVGVVLKVDSFSKTLMPALRMGWVTGHPTAVGALDRVRRDLGVSQLIARVLAEYLAEGLYEPHVARVAELYRQKRDAAMAALEQYCQPWVRWNRPPGGYFLWLELADEVDGAQVQAKALAEGVMCRPGERFFGQTGEGEGSQRLRLAFTTVPTADLERAIAVLGKAAANSLR